MDDYVWINDLAPLIGRSVSATWRLVKIHKVPTFKRPMDRKTYVRRSAVETLLSTFEPKDRVSA